MTEAIPTGIYYRAYWHQVIDLHPQQLIVKVALTTYPANVILLDDANFQKYLSGANFVYHAGGFYFSPEVLFTAPEPGRWHLVVDLADQPGIPNAICETIASSSLSA